MQSLYYYNDINDYLFEFPNFLLFTYLFGGVFFPLVTIFLKQTWPIRLIKILMIATIFYTNSDSSLYYEYHALNILLYQTIILVTFTLITNDKSSYSYLRFLVFSTICVIPFMALFFPLLPSNIFQITIYENQPITYYLSLVIVLFCIKHYSKKFECDSYTLNILALLIYTFLMLILISQTSLLDILVPISCFSLLFFIRNTRFLRYILKIYTLIISLVSVVTFTLILI